MPGNGNDKVFEVADYGAIFIRQKEAYKDTLRLQADVHELDRNVHAQITKIKATVAEALSDPRVTEEQRQEIQGLVVRAEELVAEADAAVVRVDRFRLSMLRTVVDQIGNTLQKVKAYRAEITLGEQGLATFDAALADAQARYTQVYRPYFPLAGSGITQMPDVTGWGDQEWDDIATHLDGPLFMWSPRECEEKWNVPGVPDCDGPDYFTVLAMINQIFVAKQNQLDIWAEFPIIATFDLWFLGGELEEYEEEIKSAEAALKEATDAVQDLGAIVAAILKAVRKTAETVAGLPGLLIVGGIAAFMLLRKKK